MAEPGSELQFDRAQFDAPTPMACVFCKRPLVGHYFELNGRLACERCRYQAEAAWNGGSGSMRFLKATLYGSGAAALGCALYYAVLAITGYELSLISIAVGWLVGVAVRKGASARGGWPYQLLAVLLTYTSIVGSYAPLVIGGLRERSKTASAAPKEAGGAAKDDAPEKDGATVKDGAAKKPSSPIMILVGVTVLAAVVFISPFLIVFASGGQGILGLVIIGFGMWQAWKINGKVRLQITGPLSVPVQPIPSPPDAA
jgi:hypothetical protein